MPITRFEDLDLTRQYTYADYMSWRFQERVELLRGWVAKMSPAPSTYHQTVASNFATGIGPRLKRPCRMFIAPFDVRLPKAKGGETVVQPDICVVCEEAKLTKQGCDGPPDWVIEILSKGNTKRDTRDKYRLYEESGVREYWIVDPAHGSIMRYILEGERYQRLDPCFEDDEAFSPEVLPEVVLNGAAVFLK